MPGWGCGLRSSPLRWRGQVHGRSHRVDRPSTRRTVSSSDHRSVTVVTMTRNRRAKLLCTLSALADLPERPPVIVVDNDSDDGSPAAVAAAFPAVEVIRLPGNAGAAARNVGARHARTPYVAFADDDSWW